MRGDLERSVVEAAYEGGRLSLLWFAQSKHRHRSPPEAAARQVSEFRDGEASLLETHRDAQDSVVVVERSRPLAPAFDLPARPGTVQDGVVCVTSLQVDSAGFLRAGGRQRSRWNQLNSQETEVGTR